MLLRSIVIRLAPAFALTAVACGAGTPAAGQASHVCTATGRTALLKEIPEASGLALSRRTPGTLWTHNDSGAPVVFALDAAGAVRGRVRVSNAAVDDWEDITAGPCPSTARGASPTGHCLYVADIGDNNRARRTITIYRLPEPQPGDAASAPAEAFTVRYPDGAHDAEALFVTADAGVFVITKAPRAALYRYPGALRAGGPVTLERVAELPLARVTDADLSADGRWVAVRTNDAVTFYPAADLVRGKAAGVTMPLAALEEPQGEGVALAADGTLYLVSEGGGGGRFSTMRCALK